MERNQTITNWCVGLIAAALSNKNKSAQERVVAKAIVRDIAQSNVAQMSLLCSDVPNMMGGPKSSMLIVRLWDNDRNELASHTLLDNPSNTSLSESMMAFKTIGSPAPFGVGGAHMHEFKMPSQSWERFSDTLADAIAIAAL